MEEKKTASWQAVCIRHGIRKVGPESKRERVKGRTHKQGGKPCQSHSLVGPEFPTRARVLYVTQ